MNDPHMLTISRRYRLSTRLIRKRIFIWSVLSSAEWKWVDERKSSSNFLWENKMGRWIITEEAEVE